MFISLSGFYCTFPLFMWLFYSLALVKRLINSVCSWVATREKSERKTWKKLQIFFDCAFLWSCRTFNKALSDTFHDWRPFLCRLSQCPQGRGADVFTHARVQPGCASAYPSISHAEKLVNFQNLTLHLHLVSDEYSGVLWRTTIWGLANLEEIHSS